MERAQLIHDKLGYIDKVPKFNWAIYSQRDGQNWGELESSCESQYQAERFFKQYQTWGMEDVTFYLIAWAERSCVKQFKFKKGN